MSTEPHWIAADSLVNLRDVGPMATQDGGTVAAGRLLRSDNLQTLTPADVQRLLGLHVSDVVDLRSDWEAEHEGPGPLATVEEITVHRHSLFQEAAPGTGEDKPDDDRPEALPAEALPWVDLEPTVRLENTVASLYLNYILSRPDSIVASLRDIADAAGATLVHCAAGKDRTGTVVALALRAVGADREAVVADYVASTDRVHEIVEKLMGSPTYAENLRDRPLDSHATHAATMNALLDHIDAAYGGVPELLRSIGLSAAELDQLRHKLLA